MKPQTRESLIDVVGEAMCLPAGERAAFVRASCADPAAVSEALSLVEAAQRAGGFLDRPTLDSAGPGAAAANGDAAGGTIGRYRLLELIGEGGFGRVFMAEQREPVYRRVAVKVIKAGMDTAQVVARFEAERQALALMDHPGIATVFDGGATEGGRPYFVMELVRGLPITVYCDRERLPVAERLALFRDVCGAVQHAHQKGVIHRDLKPGNVLVAEADGRPQPKIIDFGIAKATRGRLTDRTLFTEFRQFIGTPEYMSPEQALGAAGGAYGGADADTRSDIYSLGVLLYELLTGTTPLDREWLRSASLAEIQKMIGERESPRPSTRYSTLSIREDVAARRRIDPGRLGVLLRGDLDWIVLKSLEKDRDRRYETAGALSEDVRRFLEDEPVSARSPSAAYRVRKFVRRNRGAVAAGAGVAGALVIGLGLAVWQAAVAARERDAARAAEADTRRVAEFQAAQLRGIDPHAMGLGIREDLLGAAAGLAKPGLSLTAEEIADRRAQVERLLATVNLTDVARRTLDENIFARAITAANQEFREQPSLHAALLTTIGDTMFDLGLLEAATGPLMQALEIRRRELGDDHEATIRAQGAVGNVLSERGRLTEAEPYLRGALDRSRRVLGESHDATADALTNLGRLLLRQQRIAEAEACLVRALELRRRLSGPGDPATLKSIANVAVMLLTRGKAAEAEPYCREACEGFRRALGDDHPDTLKSLVNLGVVLRLQGKYAEAEPICREGLEKRRQRLGDDHVDTLRAMRNLGDLLRHRVRNPGDEPVSASLRVEAEAILREAAERHRRVLGDDHVDTLDVLDCLGRLLLALERPAEAEPILREAMAGYARTMGPTSPGTVIASLAWSSALTRVGRFSESEAILLEASRALTGHGDVCAPEYFELYTAWDKAEPGRGYDAKAAEWREKLGDVGAHGADP